MMNKVILLFLFIVITSLVRAQTIYTNCSDGLPHYEYYPYDCSKYYGCSGEDRILFNCPDDLYWNDEIKACDILNNSNCTTDTPTTAPTTITYSTTTEITSSTPLSTQTTSSTPLSTQTTSSTPLSTQTTSSTPLSTQTTSSTPLSTQTTSSTPLSTQTTSSTPLSTQTTSSTPLSTQTTSSTPLSTQTTSSTPLSTQTTSSTPLSTQTTSSTPLSTQTTSSTPLSTQTTSSTPLSTQTTSSTPLSTQTTSSTPLSTQTTSSTPLSTQTTSSTPLSTQTTSSTSLSTQTTTSTTTFRPTTPKIECSSKTEYFEYPYDCSKYYECFNGKLELLDCPENMYWNKELKGCDHLWNVDCSYTILPLKQTPASIETLKCTKENSVFGYPSDCSKYYRCIDYKLVLEQCPETLFWNKDSENCDFSDNVLCYNVDGQKSDKEQ